MYIRTNMEKSWGIFCVNQCAVTTGTLYFPVWLPRGTEKPLSGRQHISTLGGLGALDTFGQL